MGSILVSELPEADRMPHDFTGYEVPRRTEFVSTSQPAFTNCAQIAVINRFCGSRIAVAICSKRATHYMRSNTILNLSPPVAGAPVSVSVLPSAETV